VLSFQDNTIAELDAALDALDQSGTKALVLDLRGNPGGLLDVAIEAARRFLAAGVIVAVENQDARLSAIYQARAMGPIRAMPMVVLVDGDTASAAEVLAGALKDNDRARLVGQTTFGKGCSQTLVKLPAAGGLPTGGLRVTIARFFSPRGVCYTGRGIVPDLIADRFKPEAPEMDNQLAEAIADLNRQLAMR
jgi:carboxyl-terminal processing protease